MGLTSQAAGLRTHEVSEYEEDSKRSVFRDRSIVALLQLKHVIERIAKKVKAWKPNLKHFIAFSSEFLQVNMAQGLLKHTSSRRLIWFSRLQ